MQFLRREREQPFHQEGLRQISPELVRFLRLWDAMEGRKRDIIDFDLATPDDTFRDFEEHIINPPTKQERSIILAKLIEFDQRLAAVTPDRPSEALQVEFETAKLEAHIAYFRRRELEGEEAFDPLAYIEATMDLTPRSIEEEDLEAQKEVVKSLFAELGCREYRRESIEVFRGERLLPNDEIVANILQKSSLFLKGLSDFIGMRLEPKFDVEMVREDEYWINWANGDRDRFRLKVNNHRRHHGRWTAGKAEEMAIHEIVGHFAQMTAWRNAIARGDLDPALGLTSVHDPGQVTTEGIAQTLAYFVPDIMRHLSPDGDLEVEVTGLRNMVYNNVHIMVNTSSLTDEDMATKIIQYVHSYYPAEPEDEIKRQINDRRRNPLKQTYLYAYGIGYFMHRRYASILNTEGRKRLLRFIFAQPTTPEQEERYVEDLLSDPHRRYSAIRA